MPTVGQYFSVLLFEAKLFSLRTKLCCILHYIRGFFSKQWIGLIKENPKWRIFTIHIIVSGSLKPRDEAKP
jgi:hypothetical protein